jgi:endonuclease/exonuclease/phosphatase family metal-dependent hydrolase
MFPMIKRLLRILLALFLVVLAGAAGFILLLQATEYRPNDVETLAVEAAEDSAFADVAAGSAIRILTWNLGYASLSATEDFVMDGGVKGRMDSEAEVLANIDAISAVLLSEAADVYFLQEVDEDSDRSYNTLQATHYAELLGMQSVFGVNFRCVFVPFPFELGQMMGHVESGVMTFVDYAVENAERRQLPGSFSWPLRLANLKRCMVVTRLPIEGSDAFLVLVNVHLSAYDDGTMREQETAALREFVEAEYADGNYVVVGGDFNQTLPDAMIYNAEFDVWNYAYPLRDPELWQAFPLDASWFEENGWRFGTDATTPTCRLLNHPYYLFSNEDMYNQYYVIDGFIVSPNVTIDSVETLDLQFANSDHNPVVMTIHF